MKEFSIDRNTEGQRIDRYLSDELEDRSRSYIQKIMKEGYVKVNQKPVKSNYRLSLATAWKLPFRRQKSLISYQRTFLWISFMKTRISS